MPTQHIEINILFDFRCHDNYFWLENTGNHGNQYIQIYKMAQRGVDTIARLMIYISKERGALQLSNAGCIIFLSCLGA